MCGIAGILNIVEGRAPGEDALRAMVKQISHRGPDGEGYYTDETAGMGHARLSIIDIEGGAQPVHNEDSSVWTTFNGEIFNYIELRADLESRGHRFYTRTDTEVIVHLYEEYGERFVEHLNGQFAIALWDKLARVFILVRDRVGIVPLFYTSDDKTVVYASEVKSIIASGYYSPEPDYHSLDQLMTFWAPVSPNTVFRNVKEISPGTMLVCRDGKTTIRRYWDWIYPAESYYDKSKAVIVEELLDLLLDAARIRLRADVPVGAYLSGGLDSSVIVSLIRQFSDVSLRTFSIGFEDKKLDEGDFQREIINRFETDHSAIVCGDGDIAGVFKKVLWHTESPVLRTAPAPMYMLSGLVRNSDYKVVLTGEGSDEVFGGYDIFKEAKIRKFWSRYPESAFRPLLLKKLYPYLDITKSQTQEYLKNFFGVGLDRPNLGYFSHLPRWVTTARIKEFYSSDMSAHLGSDPVRVMEQSLPAEHASWHYFNKAQYLESKSLMSGYLLCSQGDRMLMGHSVEGRFPFLDHRLIEYANKLDPRLKMKVLDEKHILKETMANRLPDTVLRRHKQPYRAPDIPAFFGSGVPDYVQELTSEKKLKDYGYFDPARVGRLLGKIKKGRAIGYKDNMAFVGILSTQIWHSLFIEGQEVS